MDKELSGSQNGSAQDGNKGGSSGADGANFVDFDAIIKKSNGGAPMKAGPSQNVPSGQPQAHNPAQKIKGWMPQIADDTDLIEKEWVDKAKEIVEHTSGDPHARSEQLTHLKAEYLKKRYNKIIRPSDS